MSWKTKLDNRLQNDSVLNDYIDEFNNYLNDAINTFDVNINHSVSTIKMVIQNTSALDKTVVVSNETMLGLTVLSNIVVVGDIVTWKNEDWIVVSKDNKAIDNCHKVYIQRSNNTLLFYSDESSVLNEVPCIVGNGNLGLDENKYLSLPADEYIITCPNNLSSRKITENTRFILSNSAYIVQGIDDISMLGLLNIRVKQDTVNEDDNLELGIANYFSHQVTREIFILNGTSANLLYTNATLQLNILAKENGVIVSNPIITYLSNNVGVATVSNTGLVTAIGTGDATITATFGNVSASIIIHSVMVVNNNYNITITPTDTTLQLNKIKTFTSHFWNNGVEVFNQNCIWNLTNSDGTSNIYASLTINGFDCTVTATGNTQYVGKYVKLRSTLVSDNTKYQEREIKIVGLF